MAIHLEPKTQRRPRVGSAAPWLLLASRAPRGRRGAIARGTTGGMAGATRGGMAAARTPAAATSPRLCRPAFAPPAAPSSRARGRPRPSTHAGSACRAADACRAPRAEHSASRRTCARAAAATPPPRCAGLGAGWCAPAAAATAHHPLAVEPDDAAVQPRGAQTSAAEWAAAPAAARLPGVPTWVAVADASAALCPLVALASSALTEAWASAPQRVVDAPTWVTWAAAA